MTLLRNRSLLLITWFALSSAAPLFQLYAQQKECLPPVALPAPTEANIFTAEQEVLLGEAVAEHIQKNYRVIEDPAVTRYLAQIGEKLTRQLPLTKLRFQFFLVDLPNANAFVLPGGRIYVSRKLVALAQAEDELAGVIAHELGHLVAHESAIEMTRRLHEVLGVTTVADRADIYEKYNRLIESARLKPDTAKRQDREKGQMVADQAGLYALIAAGYDPAALSRFWDRLAETKGKTGSWLSDLFGSTRPDERRLREMIKTVGALPAECLKTRAAGQSEAFKEWQATVVSYSGLGRREALRGVIKQLQLSPPLRSDITHIRFSPDGSYVLAQDEAGINVLSREPFASLFRIEAADAKPAHFTPDSRHIVFSNDNLRVERWSIADQKLLEAHEIVHQKGCLQTSLSPGGKFMACLSTNMDLELLEVASGQAAIHRKEFVELDYTNYLKLLAAIANHRLDNGDAGLNWISMGFSPDARYFTAGYEAHKHTNRSQRYNEVVAFDLTTMNKLSLNDTVQSLVAGGFTFMGDGRLAGLNPEDPKKSAVVTFPEGKIVSEFSLRGNIEAPTRGDYLLIRPIKDHPLGVFDLNTKVIFKSNSQPALDIFGDLFVAEMRNGELGLYRMEKNQLLASTVLANITLGRLRVSDLSADLKWVALSGKSRGGVWNLSQGEAALYLRGYHGAYLSDDGSFYGDFPKYETAARNVARFNLTNGEVTPGTTIEAGNARQMGPYVVAFKPTKATVKESALRWEWRDLTMEVLDARNLSLIWSRAYPKEGPDVWVTPQHGTGVLVWDLTTEAATAEIKNDPHLTQLLPGLKEKTSDYLLEVVDMRNGKSLGKLLIDTGKGSFRLANVFAAEDWVVVTDTQNRVLIYSLKTGAQLGRVFGGFAAVSAQTGLLCVENETGKLAVYDLKSMEKKADYIFSNPIAMVRFNSNAPQLFVLTVNQTAYLLDMSSLTNPTASR